MKSFYYFSFFQELIVQKQSYNFNLQIIDRQYSISLKTENP